MRPRYPPRGAGGSHPPGMRPMGMRPPMRGRGHMHRGMGPRPPYPGMGPPPMMYGPPMGRGPGPMMPRMRPPPPHMLPPLMRPRPMQRLPKKPNKNNVNNEGKVKKKKLKFRSFYVTRPWVTDELKAEIAKKDELFQQAKSSNKSDDWNLFKEQKDKCVHMYSALKMEYIGQHPEEDIGKIMAELNTDKNRKQLVKENKLDQAAINRQQTTDNESQPATAEAGADSAAS